MDLKKAIAAEHSKAQTGRIARYTGRSRERFNALVELFLSDDPVMQQRAGWPMSIVAEDQPGWVVPHLGRLVRLLARRDVHNAVIRHTVRALQYVKIPEEYQGEVMNTCFDFVADPAQAAAVKAFSLTILEHLAEDHPDIVPELKLIIEERWPQESPAFHSRARKILQKFG